MATANRGRAEEGPIGPNVQSDERNADPRLVLLAKELKALVTCGIDTHAIAGFVSRGRVPLLGQAALELARAQRRSEVIPPKDRAAAIAKTVEESLQGIEEPNITSLRILYRLDQRFHLVDSKGRRDAAAKTQFGDYMSWSTFRDVHEHLLHELVAANILRSWDRIRVDHSESSDLASFTGTDLPRYLRSSVDWFTYYRMYMSLAHDALNLSTSFLIRDVVKTWRGEAQPSAVDEDINRVAKEIFHFASFTRRVGNMIDEGWPFVLPNPDHERPLAAIIREIVRVVPIGRRDAVGLFPILDESFGHSDTFCKRLIGDPVFNELIGKWMAWESGPWDTRRTPDTPDFYLDAFVRIVDISFTGHDPFKMSPEKRQTLETFLEGYSKIFEQQRKSEA